MADKKKPVRENKTQPTDVPVEEFLSTADEKRRNEAHEIMEMMHDISGEDPFMYGPSIIGYGKTDYETDSGCSGVIPRIAFSPRKAKLTFYFNAGFNEYGELLNKLGKHKTSVSCLYINKLSDVDKDILKEMIRITWEGEDKEKEKKITTPEEYIASVPEASRKTFDELRSIVKKALPGSKEVYSYGILGYKTDEKRPKVYISGWKDHVAVYPVPKDPVLFQELSPYIKGKGTLWFKLHEELPKNLIERTVLQLKEEADSYTAKKSAAKSESKAAAKSEDKKVK